MLITLIINPTTGKEFTIEIDNQTTIEELKRILAKKLKVGREVISLLHMNGLLTTGTLASHELTTGSTLRLVPCIETGILTPRPEQSVLEALESLNETQVSDFLTGKSPLNLTMRLGEHVMLIQLQLSKGLPVNPNSTTPQSAQSPSVTVNKQQQSSGTSSSSSNHPTNSSSSTGAGDSEQPGPSKANLSEASRSLTNTLKKLSSTVSKEDDISKHMQHHGRGIYSGTFSGTLNPVLQDPAGKPKKHVSTIVHILNDLLGGVDLKSCTTSGGARGQFVSTNSQPVKRKSTETNTSTPGISTNGSPSTSSASSSTANCSNSDGTESPIPEKLCKVANSTSTNEENIILKSKMDRLLNELKLKKKEMLARHNIKSK